MKILYLNKEDIDLLKIGLFNYRKNLVEGLDEKQFSEQITNICRSGIQRMTMIIDYLEKQDEKENS